MYVDFFCFFALFNWFFLKYIYIKKCSNRMLSSVWSFNIFISGSDGKHGKINANVSIFLVAFHYGNTSKNISLIFVI